MSTNTTATHHHGSLVPRHDNPWDRERCVDSPHPRSHLRCRLERCALSRRSRETCQRLRNNEPTRTGRLPTSATEGAKPSPPATLQNVLGHCGIALGFRPDANGSTHTRVLGGFWDRIREVPEVVGPRGVASDTEYALGPMPLLPDFS